MISPRRRTALAVGGSVVAAALVAAAIGVSVSVNNTDGAAPTSTPTPSLSPLALEGITLDALQEARVSELRDYILWLHENEAEGFIGELGWVDDADWNELADYWYQVADAHGLSSTAWAAGSRWEPGYPLTIYGAEGDDTGGENLMLNRANGQAEIVELPGRTARHGVNLAGLDFGTDTDAFSAEQPGVLGEDYFDEPAASFAYLAERGIDLVRLPFRWERLQPELRGDLDDEYAQVIDDMLDAAEQNGIEVILDLHNYGAFETDAGTLLMGTSALPDIALADVWLAIGDRWRDHPAVYAYGLMNEPHSLPGGSARDAAARWEVTTQRTVDALRDAGDATLLMVPGYDYSSLPRWRENHPNGWIDDPADNFRYEAHHYWDAIAEGTYAGSYADVLSQLAD